MALEAGTRLGAYEILSPLGAGGMGEVYRARDPRLGRDVAVKVLPVELNESPERLARFEREARLLASLSHPGIATLHGLEDAASRPFLVMELVEGETLAERIARGAIPVDEALPIARQIAEALEAAHESGIVHRDLKPANVKVGPEGEVKVLDFGLAKAFAPEDGPNSDLSQSPTLSHEATRAGVILGTAAYMSPEQAKGKPVDKRTDVFAFGIVLFEMLTGLKAFPGEDVPEVLAAIINKEPEWDALPAATPSSLQNLLARCLTKDRRNRLRDIGEARFAIGGMLSAPVGALSDAGSASSPGASWRAMSLAALSGAAVVSIALWIAMGARRPEPRPVVRFDLVLPDLDNSGLSAPAVALSQDGSRLVYATEDRLYLRELGEASAVPIRGSDVFATRPFFSPDGEWVGFWTGRALMKVSVSGGRPVTLCECRPGNSVGFWSKDGAILFASGTLGGIRRVPAAGGEVDVLIEGTGDDSPQLLPDGHTLLWTAKEGPTWDNARTVVQSLETGERRVLLTGGSDARYVATGHLVYAQSDSLMAVPFDVERLEVTGAPVPVVEGVARSGARGSTHFDISESGSLVYILDSGPDSTTSRELVWVDRSGVEQLLTERRAGYHVPRLSPDEQRLAVTIMAQQRDIWVLELGRGTQTRLTFSEGTETDPVWSPDGSRIAYFSEEGVMASAVDGGDDPVLLGERFSGFPAAWSPDGKTIALHSRDIALLSLEGEPTITYVMETDFAERDVSFSPDGRWLAYSSDESGNFEVYVRPYPDLGAKHTISIGGGTEPLWTREGREIVYRSGDRMMAVPVSADPEFAAGTPIELFRGRYAIDPYGANTHNYDVTSDGERFVMIKEGEQEGTSSQIRVVLNWTEELKRLVPTD